MKKDYKISVIIPFLNTKKEYISRCLRSINNQTYKNFECFVIDDGSDNKETIDYVAKICTVYKNFSYIKLDNNQGIGYARNVGFDKSTGQIIVFVDSDDMLIPSALEVINTQFSENDLDILVFNVWRLTNWHLYEVTKIKQDSSVTNLALDNELITQTQSAWAKAYKKQYLLDNKIRHLDKKLYMEDLYFFFLNLSRAKKIKIIKEKIYVSRNTENSLLNTSVTDSRLKDIIYNYAMAYKDTKNDYSELSNNFDKYMNYSLHEVLEIIKLDPKDKQLQSKLLGFFNEIKDKILRQ